MGINAGKTVYLLFEIGKNHMISKRELKKRLVYYNKEEGISYVKVDLINHEIFRDTALSFATLDWNPYTDTKEPTLVKWPLVYIKRGSAEFWFDFDAPHKKGNNYRMSSGIVSNEEDRKLYQARKQVKNGKLKTRNWWRSSDSSASIKVQMLEMRKNVVIEMVIFIAEQLRLHPNKRHTAELHNTLERFRRFFPDGLYEIYAEFKIESGLAPLLDLIESNEAKDYLSLGFGAMGKELLKAKDSGKAVFRRDAKTREIQWRSNSKKSIE